MRRSFRRPVSFAVLGAATLGLAAGCASTGTAPIEGATGTTQSTVRVDAGPGNQAADIRLTHDDRAVETELTVPADRAYGVLPSVYESVGLPINTAVSSTMTIGVNAARLRRVGKQPMSRFLTCGSDITGTPLADSYAVTLTVMSRVTPQGTGASLLSTQVLATAQPMSVSGSQINCQSTGALEDLIRKTTLLRTAG